MKTLQAFWHWVDNEKPPAAVMHEKAHLTVSALGLEAIESAAERIHERANRDHVSACRAFILVAESHRAALRDLSLGLVPLLEAMHGAVTRWPVRDPGDYGDVPVQAPDMRDGLELLRPMRQDEWTKMLAPPRPSDSAFRREYLAEWLPAVAPAPIVPQCPGCCSAPCRGASPGCNLDDYLAGNPAAAVHFQRLTQPDIYQQQQAAANHSHQNQFHGQTRSNYYAGGLEIFTTVTVDELDRFRGCAPSSIRLRGKPGQYVPSVLAYLGDVIGPMLIDGAMLTTPEAKDGEWRGHV